jgi:hypothetical protein
MRVILAIAWIAILTASAALGETYVSGDIAMSTAWTPAGSPYIIQSNVSVIDDSLLDIHPGVTVAFDGDYYLGAIGGSAITADGTAGDRIRFTSNSGTPAPGDWKWVEAEGPNPSSFQYCTFEYAEQGLRASDSAPTVSYCTMRFCSSAGLFMVQASPTLQNCEMYACHDGVMISGNQCNPTIHFCNIFDNTSWNLYVMDFPEPAATIDCENNWWGTTVEAEIAQDIRDSADNPSLFATIDYTPWLMAQPVAEASWANVKALFRR